MFERVDKPLFFTICILLVSGLVIFGSAALGVLAANEVKFFSVIKTQLVYALLGGGIALCVGTLIPYRLYKKYAYVLFILALIATILVFVPGLLDGVERIIRDRRIVVDVHARSAMEQADLAQWHGQVVPTVQLRARRRHRKARARRDRVRGYLHFFQPYISKIVSPNTWSFWKNSGPSKPHGALELQDAWLSIRLREPARIVREQRFIVGNRW
jgi:hypothetical protein